MKKLTKFISLLLAVMLVCSCFAGLTVSAAGDGEAGDVYSVFGSSEAVFGGTWFAANPTTEMTLDPEDGLYKITFSNVEPTQMLQFKVIKNHDENYSWGAPGTDQNYTVNIDQECDLTITFDPVNEVVNALGDYVTVPQGIQINNVVAVGNGEETYLNDSNWDPCDPGNMMTEVQPGIWEITYEEIYAFDNYNIKFAANSLDENENPVSNPWAINWGSEVEKIYPTGQWIDATYNGKNCIFEVEDDESVVTFRLDLRNFNFVTKQGARFMIIVNGQEPTDAPATEEPITEVPTTVEPTTEAPTEAPETIAPTTAEPTEAPTTKPVNPDATTLTVKTTSNLFSSAQRTYSSDDEGGIPSTVTVVYYADVDNLRLQSIQCSLEYDTSVLTLDPAKNAEYDEDYEEYNYNNMIPVAGGLADVNPDTPGVVKFAVTKYDGLRLKKSGQLVPIIKAVFDVAPGASGTTVTNLKFGSIVFIDPKTEAEYFPYTIANGFNETDYNAIVGESGDIGSYVDEPSDENPTEAPSTEAPTPKPTTEPVTAAPDTEPSTAAPDTEPTTQPVSNPDPGTGLTVNAISNLWATATKNYAETPETVTVTYFADLSVSTMRLQNIQFSVDYDPSVLTVDKSKNGVWDEDLEDYDFSQAFPVAIGVGDTNFDLDGSIKFAVSKWDGFRLSKNGELIPIAKVVFDVAPGASGSTDVTMKFGTITFLNSKTEEEYIVHSNAYGLDQDNYNYITSIGTLRSIVDDEIVIDPAKAATCTESGLTEGKHNAVTGEVIVAQEVIPALGHDEVIDPAVPVTCTVDGKTQGSHCARCGEILVAQETIVAKGHQNVSVPKVDATCTQPGHTAGLQCSVCGIKIMGMNEIPAKGHTPVNDAAAAATCTQPGHTAGTHCSVCNEILSGNEVIPAKGHTVVNDPEVPATCTVDGHTAGTHCSVCNEVLSGNEVIEAKGHQNVSVSKVDATCTEPGHTAGLKCSVCGITIMGIKEIPAKGHTPVEDAELAPTCTQPGHTAGTHCSVCNEILSGNEVIPALGHDEIVKPGRPATYTQTGLTEGVFCNRCKKWVVQQQVIPKLVSQFDIGDVNRDGKIDVLDAILAQKYATEKTTLTDEQIFLGDVNGDGFVDVLDATLIQKYAAERISEFPKKK